MHTVNTAVQELGQALGLPHLALDPAGTSSFAIGEHTWTLQWDDHTHALLLVCAVNAPHSTGAQIETALWACNAHSQTAQPPGTFRLGLRGQGSARQWVGCLRLRQPLSAAALLEGIDTLAQWMQQCTREAGVAEVF
jgi:hypothetical protein